MYVTLNFKNMYISLSSCSLSSATPADISWPWTCLDTPPTAGDPVEATCWSDGAWMDAEDRASG